MRAVDRYQRGELPAFDKAVERGGVGSIPYLVCAQVEILIAGVLMIAGVIARFLGEQRHGGLAVLVVTLLIGAGAFFALGVWRITLGVLAKRRQNRR